MGLPKNGNNNFINVFVTVVESAEVKGVGGLLGQVLPGKKLLGNVYRLFSR